jgi:hypothetical protein
MGQVQKFTDLKHLLRPKNTFKILWRAAWKPEYWISSVQAYPAQRVFEGGAWSTANRDIP